MILKVPEHFDYRVEISQSSSYLPKDYKVQMIRRTFMQAIGLSLFSPTIANNSKVTKYLDKNLIIVSEAEMESIRKKAGLLFIPRCRLDSKSDILSEMKYFVEMCEHYNVPITNNIYGNLNKKGVSIISYNEHQDNYSDFSFLWQNKPQATNTIVWKSRLDNADRRGIL